jgi:hypothetical protein
MPWQASIVFDYGSFTELSEIDADRSPRSGFSFYGLRTARYHDPYYVGSLLPPQG